MKFFVLISTILLIPLACLNRTLETVVVDSKEFIEERDPTEIIVLASVINSESHGESYIDKLRVGTVIMNRVVSDKFPNTLYEVVYQKKQFSGINSARFKYDISYPDLVNQDIDQRVINRAKYDYDSVKAAREIYNGKRVLKQGYLFFFNPSTSVQSEWLEKKKHSKNIVKGEKHWFSY